jgi:hypothetical protein
MHTNIKGQISGRHDWDGFCVGSVEFCTNGPQGGGAGYGGFLQVTFTNSASTCIEVAVDHAGPQAADTIAITFHGDAEIDAAIKSFEFLAAELRAVRASTEIKQKASGERDLLASGATPIANADGHNFKQLQAEILKLSSAKDWPSARREWKLSTVYRADQDETCLCGHHPIRQVCLITNSVNGSRTEVGNVCVKRFLGLRSDRVFQGLRRIGKDQSKSLNDDVLVLFHSLNMFTRREYEFLQDTRRKRVLTSRQRTWRIELNKRVLTAVQRRGLQVPCEEISAPEAADFLHAPPGPVRLSALVVPHHA